MYEHHKLLVLGISLLNQFSVLSAMIVAASNYLNQYVKMFQNLYGLHYMTCNLHQLRHLPSEVYKFGPSRTTSCFQHENSNGVIRRLLNGTRYAQL